MRIGELGLAAGVDVETVRFYEKSGLLPTPTRSGNGYRMYGPKHVERLAFIRHCRALDISLKEVKRLLEFVEQPDADCGDIDRLIDTQLAKVRARLKSLKALEKQLTSLKGSCGENRTAGECGILHELVTAAHSEACVCAQERS